MDDEMKVVHCKKAKYDVYIGRGGKWGNPFLITPSKSRSEVIEEYEEYLRNNDNLLSDLHELDGKVLGCWCSPKSCHGDVLIKLRKEQMLAEE